MVFYNVRSLVVQWRRQVLSIAIVAASTATFIIPVSAFRSFADLMRMSSEPDNVVILSSGSAELWPSMSRSSARVLADLQTLSGIARSPAGDPLVSPEFLYTAEIADGSRAVRLSVRGVEDRALLVHRVVSGSWRAGELLVGRGAQALLPGLQVGDQLEFGGRAWRVGGFFGPSAGQTQFDCEIWAPLAELMAVRRERDYGPITIKAESAAAARDLVAAIAADQTRFREVRAVPESALVQDIYKILNALGVVQAAVSLILLAIAGFAVLNVQLSNVFRRRSDMALLRAFGASRFEIASGFVLEGGLIALAGALLGATLGVLAENHPIETGALSREGLLIVRLTITPTILGLATLAGTLLGVFASLLPAWYATGFTVREERRAA